VAEGPRQGQTRVSVLRKDRLWRRLKQANPSPSNMLTLEAARIG
jgi:hypothetical protein